MGIWDGNSWSWKLSWRRPLKEREVSVLVDLMSNLNQVVLRQGVTDRLSWLNNCEEGYLVSSAYASIKGFWNHVPDPIFKQIWCLKVPANIKAFIWRALWDRLLTKVNLVRRGIVLDEDGMKCPFCMGPVESMSHLFFTCPISYHIWCKCYSWLGFESVLPDIFRLHFLQHSQSRWKKKQKQCWNSLWAAVVWSLWLARNNTVFNQVAVDSDQLLDLIQWRSWSWLSSFEKEFRSSMFEWKSDPGSCVDQL